MGRLEANGYEKTTYQHRSDERIVRVSPDAGSRVAGVASDTRVRLSGVAPSSVGTPRLCEETAPVSVRGAVAEGVRVGSPGRPTGPSNRMGEGI
jgi:hypothetical protein